MTSAGQNQVAIPEQIQRIMLLESIFMPSATEQRRKLYEATGYHARFVHYTSAEAALSIIKTKRVWMRNTTCMSDYSEVLHGYEIIRKFFHENHNKEKFLAALEDCAPGVAMEAITLFDQWWIDIQLNTYIAAVSEHDEEEDSHGRLSMWRAFGGNVARVAIVFNVPWFSEGSLSLNLVFSPVAYLKEEKVHDELNTVISNVRANSDFLHSVEREHLVNIVFNMLVSGVVCLKHEGFHEEREWRVIYAPKRLPSPLMESSSEIIGGIPQLVYKIPFDMTVSDVLSELELSKIFDRLIIGPSSYSWAMRGAFVTALAEAGVVEAENRVFTSNIPIRT